MWIKNSAVDMLFVIEHLEPKLSEWLYIEYSHAAQIAGRKKILITNVKRKSEFRKLANIANVEFKRACELFSRRDLLVLDPCAKRKLSPVDLQGKKAVVVGGILGNDPPLSRTDTLLTRTLPRALIRSLGDKQFSIDGAVYMAKQVSRGKLLEKIPVRRGLEIDISRGHSVLLPYAYPLVGGRVLISRKLIAYLKRPWKLSLR